jgi:hypothetical protein
MLLHRRNERKGIDLAVRMMQRNPDSFTFVFENQHILDLFPAPQLLVAVLPDPNQIADMPDRLIGQGPVMARRIEDDFTFSLGRFHRCQLCALHIGLRRLGLQRRELILENNNLIILSRYLRGKCPGLSRAQGTEILRRLIRAIHSVGGCNHPFLTQWMPS